MIWRYICLILEIIFQAKDGHIFRTVIFRVSCEPAQWQTEDPTKKMGLVLTFLHQHRCRLIDLKKCLCNKCFVILVQHFAHYHYWHTLYFYLPATCNTQCNTFGDIFAEHCTGRNWSARLVPSLRRLPFKIFQLKVRMHPSPTPRFLIRFHVRALKHSNPLKRSRLHFRR